MHVHAAIDTSYMITANTFVCSRVFITLCDPVGGMAMAALQHITMSDLY